MADPLLLNLSNSHLFWKGKEPQEIEPHHRPSLLAFPRDPKEKITAARARLAEAVAAAGDDTDASELAKVHSVGDPLKYKSFWNHGESRDVIPVVGKRSYWVPEISDELFFEHGFYTAEHDIPYMERALADLAAEKDWWLLDTRGRPAKLDVLTYDIETTAYGTGVKEIPIDMVGYSNFEVKFEAAKDLDTESFDFRFTDLPTDWADREVIQHTAHNPDEEIDLLDNFTRHVVKHDVIAGHNVLGFDNKQIHDRIKALLQQDQRQQNLSPGTRDWFREFTNVYSRHDRSFHFGTSQDIAVWHPITLDTFHAARKFYFFHDDFSLKGLAPWLGIEVPDRVYLEPAEQKLDAATLQYNKHDVQEQIGITQVLLAQALPLCFTVNLPMSNLLTGGNTKMWDHMAFIRARREHRMMPATCRAQAIARGVQRMLPRKPFPTREEVAEAALTIPRAEATTSRYKEFVRVVKQGPEMPFWVEHPGVIVKPGEGPAQHGYAIPGGMTLKPDSDLKSHFVPWFHVVAADVGAMYPTILKAQNLTADTVRPAYANEKPDDWLWLFELDEGFTKSKRYHVRKPDPEKERYAKGRGWMIGVKHSRDDGMVNKAMTGILDTIQKVKDARAKAKEKDLPADEIRVLDMTYASLKAARNAGTHGILVAVNVSCRQFNVWGGANITTIGQRILHESLEDFEAEGIRVVYGDTDGIYLACSKSAGNLPHLAAALDADVEPEADKWITLPNDALKAVAKANTKFRKQLNYPAFELEAELHDCMVFVVHKNYLIFDERSGEVRMETKGNNFKGSDKAPLAQRVLGDIMRQALREVAAWDDEEDARETMKTAIKRATKDVMASFRISDVSREEFVLRQSVQPIRSYKPNPDGSPRVQAWRALALEDLLNENIESSRKMKFIVCKNPLPLYGDDERAALQKSGPSLMAYDPDHGHVPDPLERSRSRLRSLGFSTHGASPKLPKKSAIRPIEYMWPVELVRQSDIDLHWYRDVIENYVKGAFGFSSLELPKKRDVASWF